MTSSQETAGNDARGPQVQAFLRDARPELLMLLDSVRTLQRQAGRGELDGLLMENVSEQAYQLATQLMVEHEGAGLTSLLNTLRTTDWSPDPSQYVDGTQEFEALVNSLTELEVELDYLVNRLRP